MNPQKKLTHVGAVLFLAMFTLVGSAWSQTPTAADADLMAMARLSLMILVVHSEVSIPVRRW